jgi:hypothetical protein
MPEQTLNCHMDVCTPQRFVGRLQSLYYGSLHHAVAESDLLKLWLRVHDRLELRERPDRRGSPQGRPIRDNILATSTPSNASTSSRKPADLDWLDPYKRIYAGRSNLRALWGDFPVVVRVHLGALEKPCYAGLFFCSGAITQSSVRVHSILT